MPDEVSVNRDIAAAPDLLWAMVSDVTRMGEWSPESDGATWVAGADGPQAGARFRGRNSHGKKKWETDATVVEAEPGRMFSFRVTAAGFKVAEWRYTFEPIDIGCRVTETWIDRRGRIAKALGKPVSGVADRAAHNRAGMEQTLDRLKTAAESAHASG
jgi:uncharacterized protein YndB with AHSA1/START domain